MEGTFPLPEAQRDRFTARLSMGYPSPAAELAMLDTHGGGDPLAGVRAVTETAVVAALMDMVRRVFVADSVRRYIVDLVNATRRHPEIRLGASPRAGLHLLRASRAAAALEGRGYVLPDDVQMLATSVLAHRLMLRPEAQLARRTGIDIVTELVAGMPVPSSAVRQ
jgi:MoxR-like ATPase